MKMDALFFPPESVVELLKCSLCENYLSVAPVALISEDGGSYKCGRCTTIKTTINTRAVIYEHVAKLMMFPCIYKGCSKKLSFLDTRDHEKVCEQRTVTCPKANCLDVFKVQKLAEHFKEKHSDAHHSNTFNIRNVYAYYNIDLLEKNGKTFVSFFDFDDVHFGITVCALDQSDTHHQYEIKLKSEKSNYWITIGNQSIVPFNEREHCFKCASGHCKFKHHVYRDNRKEISRRMTTKINRDSLKKLFGPGLLSYTINVDEKDEKPKQEDVKVEVKDALIRKAKKIFLQLLECPFCKAYMSPPIYQCATGHTVCRSCRDRSSVCSSCDEPIGKTRNFTLEELSKKVELPTIPTTPGGGDEKQQPQRPLSIKSANNDTTNKRYADEPDTTEGPGAKVAKK